MTKDIYAFDDPVSFISERIKQIKPALTHREFSNRLGLSSPATLSHILSGYRKISLELISPIAKALELNNSEERFFHALVLFYRSKNPAEKEALFSDLQKMRIRSNCFQIELKHHAYFGSWYFAPLLEILYYQDIPYSECSSLGRALEPSISSQDAKRAIDRMIEIGMVEVDENGILRRMLKVISSEGIPISILRNLNREYLEIAKAAQDSFAREERNISSVTIAMSEENFQRASVKMDELRQFILGLTGSKSNMDRVMQFTFAAHPLTKLKETNQDD